MQNPKKKNKKQLWTMIGGAVLAVVVACVFSVSITLSFLGQSAKGENVITMGGSVEFKDNNGAEAGGVLKLSESASDIVPGQAVQFSASADVLTSSNTQYAAAIVGVNISASAVDNETAELLKLVKGSISASGWTLQGSTANPEIMTVAGVDYMIFGYTQGRTGSNTLKSIPLNTTGTTLSFKGSFITPTSWTNAMGCKSINLNFMFVIGQNGIPTADKPISAERTYFELKPIFLNLAEATPTQLDQEAQIDISGNYTPITYEEYDSKIDLLDDLINSTNVEFTRWNASNSDIIGTYANCKAKVIGGTYQFENFAASLNVDGVFSTIYKPGLYVFSQQGEEQMATLDTDNLLGLQLFLGDVQILASAYGYDSNDSFYMAQSGNITKLKQTNELFDYYVVYEGELISENITGVYLEYHDDSYKIIFNPYAEAIEYPSFEGWGLTPAEDQLMTGAFVDISGDYEVYNFASQSEWSTINYVSLNDWYDSTNIRITRTGDNNGASQYDYLNFVGHITGYNYQIIEAASGVYSGDSDQITQYHKKDSVAYATNGSIYVKTSDATEISDFEANMFGYDINLIIGVRDYYSEATCYRYQEGSITKFKTSTSTFDYYVIYDGDIVDENIVGFRYVTKDGSYDCVVQATDERPIYPDLSQYLEFVD